MAQEIEHKYTVHRDKLPIPADGIKITQGYLPTPSLTKTRIRVRSCKNIEAAYITIKGEKIGESCLEFEYEIPLEDGLELLRLCDDCVSKTRYEIPYGGNTWELDIFEGHNSGLIIAEIEFDTIGETYAIPEWADDDVTYDPRYFNSHLAEDPFKDW